ncbi:LysE family transporter [Ferrovibrio sp.]|uniref:LysE family translocator n=1 Tax=Ferrovibrio sp. TaxID=1917215 RepID=UPI00311D3D49
MSLVPTMTPAAIAALFGAMAVLALIPSVSVLTVTARAAGAGFRHGAAASLGIIAADLLFILAAVFGLALLAETLGPAFGLVKYLGGAYLLLLGISLLRAARQAGRDPAGTTGPSSLAASFMLGLTVTLGDQKAILFYLGFLPAFVDLAAVAPADIAIIMICTILAVGGAKLGYAWAASRAGTVFGARGGRILTVAAGAVMIATGAFLVFTAG